MNFLSLFLLGLIMSRSTEVTTQTSTELLPAVSKYLTARAAEFENIPAERKVMLQELADHVKACSDADKTAHLVFICTHNSRRSHLAQIWALAAAEFYGIPKVETWSGGTEATAFNPRAVAAIQRAGLQVSAADEKAANPHYKVSFRQDQRSFTCFSKVFSESPNPSKDFCAVMTCTQADEACPLVSGCSERIAIPYEDPKKSDGSLLESATYDERSQQICREMMYVMWRASQS